MLILEIKIVSSVTKHHVTLFPMALRYLQIESCLSYYLHSVDVQQVIVGQKNVMIVLIILNPSKRKLS